MSNVAATEFARNFSQYREAAQREPVAVVAHKRIAGYFLSARDFAEYQRLKATFPKALALDELDADTIAAVAQVSMDQRHTHLNALLD